MKLLIKSVAVAAALGAASWASAQSWPVYGGDTGNQRYSQASQITPANVNKLSVKWALQLGSNRSQESTPILVGDTLVAAKLHERLQHGVALEAVAGDKFLQAFTALLEQGEEQVLGRNELVLEGLGLLGGGSEDVLQILGGIHLASALNLGPAAEFGFEIGGEPAGIHPQLLQELRHEAILLLRQ